MKVVILQKGIFYIALVTLLISCAGLKKKPNVVAGTWQKNPITIDGDNAEWPSPYPNYDAKALVGYATSNDKENIYVTLETGDEMTQLKILKGGMTVWVDTDGGKTQTMGINYPLPDVNEPYEAMPQTTPGRGGNTQGTHKKMLTQQIKRSIASATQLTLQGFEKCNGGFIISQANECGIKVKMNINEFGELVWEAAIPFKTLFHKTTIDAKDAGHAISVCFAIKGIKKTTSGKSDDQAQTAGMSDGGAGGMGRGMSNTRAPHGSGKIGQQANPADRLFETTKTWKHFAVAYQLQ